MMTTCPALLKAKTVMWRKRLPEISCTEVGQVPKPPGNSILHPNNLLPGLRAEGDDDLIVLWRLRLLDLLLSELQLLWSRRRPAALLVSPCKPLKNELSAECAFAAGRNTPQPYEHLSSLTVQLHALLGHETVTS